MERLYTVSEAATITGFTPQYIRKLIADGSIITRAKRGKRIPDHALYEFVTRRKLKV